MANEEDSQTSWGYSSGFTGNYEVSGLLGRGGYATVNKVKHKQSGQYFACKMLPKRLEDPDASQMKRETHSRGVRHEVPNH
jgi:serine/threonine protein kinase